MIILRQKSYSKKKRIGSYFVSQIEPESNPEGNNFHLLNGKIYRDEEPELRIPFSKACDMQNKKTGYPGGVRVKGRNIFIKNFQGEDKNTGRTTYQVFISDKSPKEAYKDWLKGVEQRQNLPDLKPGGKPTLSSKEIKAALRKEIKKKNLKTAATIGLGVGTIAAGTMVGVKAYKKDKKK